MKKKVLFLGSKRLGLNVLKKIISIAPNSVLGAITLDDRADSRSVYDEFNAFCIESNIAFYIADNRKHSEEIIRQLHPEMCLVAGWYWIIGLETLESVSNKFIGIHNSLLPKYRGSSPLIWAMINGETEIGFSIFSFTQEMDEGEIWASGKVEVSETDAVGDVLIKLETKTLAVLETIYPNLLNETAISTEQNHTEATYCSPRFPFDGEIDWNSPASKVYNFIRAQSDPYPGAFTFFNGEKLTIWKARLNPMTYYGTQGQVAKISDKGILVVCGDSKSIILELVEVKGIRYKAGEIIKSVKTRFSKMPAI